MKRMKTRWLFFALLITILPIESVDAKEVQQVETSGAIGFTGIYEPIGTPDPQPPGSIVRPPVADVAKPSGTLPKTNEREHPRLIRLGVLLIGISFLLWERKNKPVKN
ncbi:LPXTG cell wall anchor domain-containing protein [Enterococcus casseliflavus]|uniref:LPXTG cell wall anchor domain-containing protein n=1 Tax=Enterococcus casseliflavus TaxID=37734 RepID=UPI00119D55DB|nr:LPXTG cell wall anchor domain-containing protein [Enterococcus casseliflavus]